MNKLTEREQKEFDGFERIWNGERLKKDVLYAIVSRLSRNVFNECLSWLDGFEELYICSDLNSKSRLWHNKL